MSLTRYRSLTHYSLRQLPTGVLATTATIGIVWAVATHLETTFERTVLAAITTIGLNLTSADAAHTMTSAGPTTLRRRRVARAGLALTGMFGAWLIAGAGAALSHPSGPHLGRWDALQWVVVASSQISVGALAAVHHPADPPISPGVFMAAVWCGFTAGQAHELLYEIDEHTTTWIALGAAFAGATVVSWHDPAHRPRSPW